MTFIAIVDGETQDVSWSFLAPVLGVECGHLLDGNHDERDLSIVSDPLGRQHRLRQGHETVQVDQVVVLLV